MTKVQYDHKVDWNKNYLIRYYLDNQSVIKQRAASNKKVHAVRNYAREKLRKQTDPLFLLGLIVRKRTLDAVKRIGCGKSFSSMDYIGCDSFHLKHHIESQFKPGMTWENHGLWHIDHKKPLCLATNELELIDLLHWTNIQPLWAAENLIKGAKYG